MFEDVGLFLPDPVQATTFSTVELPLSVPSSQPWFVSVTVFLVLRLTVDKLGPVYRKKSCSSKESYPSSRVNCSERLYAKKS